MDVVQPRFHKPEGEVGVHLAAGYDGRLIKEAALLVETHDY